MSKTEQSPLVFHRNDLAKKLANRIMTVSPGASSSSGLFLSAPRRTGKSTFIREDLRPALQDTGAIVIYTDLWEDKQADPGKVIISAIRAEVSKYDGVIKRLAKNVGMDKLSLGGMSFLIDKVGLNQDISISAALVALSDETKKPIALIIDEAQHAITTRDGNDTLFALKAARDEVNSSLHYGLRVIATGSSQSKLAMLRNSKDQAFFGAHIFPFPNLDDKYIEWFCQHQEFGKHLNQSDVLDLFARASFRPEILGIAAEVLKYDFELQDEDVPSRFSDEVIHQIELLNDSLYSVVHSLTPIQFAVLKVLAKSGSKYAPFESETLGMYRAVLDEAGAGDDVKTDVTSVQQALTSLQEKSLVWKESRGVYALEDISVADIFNDKREKQSATPKLK